MFNKILFFCSIFGIIFIEGCSLAPEYHPPKIDAPLKYKEAGSRDNTNWTIAQPNDIESKGNWWLIYGDPDLNHLQNQATESNQSLKSVFARIKAFDAIQSEQESGRKPNIEIGAGQTRQMNSANHQEANSTQNFVTTSWRLQSRMEYELDFFGRIENTINAASADLQQQQNLFHSALLALQTSVAQMYFHIRQLDNELSIHEKIIILLEESHHLMTLRFDAGVIDKLELSRIKAELFTSKMNLYEIKRKRAYAEHSLAVLIGKSPTEFNLDKKNFDFVIFDIPEILPSKLLERRPDIAAAERAMAANNARIGIARATFFPQMNINAALGYETSSFKDLTQWSSRTFLLGPLAGTILSLPIYDGGFRKAMVSKANANYEESVASYRQTILNAFQEVESGLSDLRILEQQIEAQDSVLEYYQQRYELSQIRYSEGHTNYLDVIVSTHEKLSQEQVSLKLKSDLMFASISLIKALGGGWKAL